MKVLFFNFIVTFFFVVSPILAMEDEEAPKYSKIIPPQQTISPEEALPLSSHGGVINFENLPEEHIAFILTFVDVRDLGRLSKISRRFNRIIEDSSLWRCIGLRYYGDFLSEEDLRENSKQNVISHHLSVLVNATGYLKKIERFVSLYRLYLYAPLFKEYLDPAFLTDFVENLSDRKEFIAQGNQKVISRKVHDLLDQACGYNAYGYWDNNLHGKARAAAKLNDFLVERGDINAIKRKINGLITGDYGYERNPDAVREFNDLLVEKGDAEAINRKIVVLETPEWHFNGYDAKDWITYDNRTPRYGYKEDWAAAKKLKDLLAKNPLLAKENDLLVERGDSEAIERKVKGLTEGEYSYDRNPTAARELNELLIEQGDQEAIKRKIEGLERGAFGYEKDPVAAKELNELLVEQGDPEAIKRKISGLIDNRYGYKINPALARDFIEHLIISEFPIARGIGKYLKAFAMKYGISELGYEKEREKAFEFIKQNHVPY